ncbi:hypothetical protein ACT7DB_01075 [Bacillus cereus]
MYQNEALIFGLRNGGLWVADSFFPRHFTRGFREYTYKNVLVNRKWYPELITENKRFCI